MERVKCQSLSRKMLVQFVACIAVLLLLATPLFYLLTKHYYAEDMIDIIEAVRSGQPIPALDLEEDIMKGVMIQFAVITFVLVVAMVLTVRFISRRLWQPFDRTLCLIEGFRLENGRVPDFPESNVTEFVRLDSTLRTLMHNSLASYNMRRSLQRMPHTSCRRRLLYSKASLTCCSSRPTSPSGRPFRFRGCTKLPAGWPG